jgi:hypothetical protein
MSRAKFAFCMLLIVMVVGCNGRKPDDAAQQAPAGTQPAASQPAPAQQTGQSETAAVQTPEKPADRPSTSPQQVKPQTAGKTNRPSSASAPQQQAPPPSPVYAPVVENKPVEPPPPPKPPEPKYAVIESGTGIPVRLQEALDSGVNKTGEKFNAILDKDIVVGGELVAARGCVLEGKLPAVTQSGRVEGVAAMSLQLVSITIGDKAYPMQTETLSFQAESTKKKDATKVGIAAGIGTVIGAIAGGGKGAAIGAAVGGGAGTATVLATRGKEVKFDPEHAFTFMLRSPVKVQLK